METNFDIKMPTTDAAIPKIRPILVADEWWDSYVSRALEANGYQVQSGYMLEKFEHTIEGYVGANRAELHQIEYMDDEVRCRFGPFILPNWAVRGPRSSVLVCGHCLAKSPHIRMVWRLRSSVICQIHGEELEQVCPCCKRPWYAQDCGRVQCRCGQDMRKMELSEINGRAPANIFSGDSQKSYLIYESDAQIHPEIDSINPEEELACQILMHRVIDALRSVHVNVLGPNGTSVRTRTFIPPDDLAMTLSSFSKLWRSLDSAAHLGMALSEICEIQHSEKSFPTLLSTLPLWEFAKELADLGASTGRAERKGWVKVGELTQGFVTLKIAARRAGIAEATLLTLKKHGIVLPEKVLGVGDPQFLYSPQQVQELAKFRGGEGYGSGLGPREKSVLRHSGMVGLMGNRQQWIDPEGVASLIASLESIALDVGRTRSARFRLSSSSVWNWKSIDAIAAFFKKLQSAEIPIFSDRCSRGFSRFYVDGDAIGWLAHEARKSMGKCRESAQQKDFFECAVKQQRKLTRSQMSPPCTYGGSGWHAAQRSVQAELWS